MRRMYPRLSPIFTMAIVVIIVSGLGLTLQTGTLSLPDRQSKAVSLYSVTSSIPAAPSHLAAEVLNDHQVRLTWWDMSSNETGFRIWNDPGTRSMAFPDNVPANSTSYVVSNLTPNTSYRFLLTAVNGYYESATATAATVTTMGGANNSAPAAPSSPWVAYSPAANILTYYWNDNAGNETGFTIRIADGQGTLIRTQEAGPATTAVGGADIMVTSGQSYQLSVLAHNGLGNSAYGAPISFTVPGASTYAMPTFGPISVQPVSSTQVRFSWSMTGGVTPDRYAIAYLAGNNYNYLPDNIPGSSTSYTLSGLQPSTTYRFMLRAIYSGYETGYQPQADSVTTSALAGSLNTPTNLRATIYSDTTIYVFWNDNSTGDTSSTVSVYDKTAGAAKPNVIFNTANLTSVGYSIISNLAADHTYTFKVKQSGPGGETPYSAEFDFTINNPAGTVNPPASPQPSTPVVDKPPSTKPSSGTTTGQTGGTTGGTVTSTNKSSAPGNASSPVQSAKPAAAASSAPLAVGEPVQATDAFPQAEVGTTGSSVSGQAASLKLSPDVFAASTAKLWRNIFTSSRYTRLTVSGKKDISKVEVYLDKILVKKVEYGKAAPKQVLWLTLTKGSLAEGRHALGIRVYAKDGTYSQSVQPLDIGSPWWSRAWQKARGVFSRGK